VKDKSESFKHVLDTILNVFYNSNSCA